MGFLDSLPIIGEFTDNSEQQALDAIERNRALFDIALPELKQYNPEMLTYAGDYTPEAMAAETVSEDPRLRGYQLASLGRMENLAQTGLSAEDNLAFERARRNAESVAQSGVQNALQNAQARGVAGGGMEYALRQGAAQSAANRAQEASLQQADTSARQRALYEQAMLQGSGQVRGQDFANNQANTNALNQFNQMNTQNRNQAQQLNLGNRQNISNQNVGLRNQAQLTNNDIRNAQFGNQMQKSGGQAGVNNQLGQFYTQQSAANKQNRNALLQSGIGLAGLAML